MYICTLPVIDILISNTHTHNAANPGSRAMARDFIAEFYKERETKGNTFVIDTVVAKTGLSHTLARNTLNAIANEENPLIKLMKIGNRVFYTLIDKNIENMYNDENSAKEVGE